MEKPGFPIPLRGAGVGEPGSPIPLLQDCALTRPRAGGWGNLVPPCSR